MKITFDSSDTYIQANTDNPEDLEIHADQDIILDPDADVRILGDLQMANNNIYFDSTDTFIKANTDATEDLEIGADDDIKLMPDDDIHIYAGSTLYASFKGGEQHLEVPAINFGDEDLATYDEGTWTPALDGGATATVANARYIRIGDLVNVWCQLRNIQENGSQSGDVTISGLPFSPSVSNAVGNCMLYGVTFTGGRGNMTVYTDGTNLLIYESITNAAWNALEWSAFADGDYIYLQATYTVQ
tara:strand:- start:1307 stop:2038 length:732 start_codon:yes stop_codon:yes gene_type:complete